MRPTATQSREGLPAKGQRGATMIEILVTLVILMIGLLGLVGVMVQSQHAQFESYQRTQALQLVQDMAARINSNKIASTCYLLGGFVGTGAATPTASGCTTGTERATADLREWHDLLLGSAEVSGADKVGAVVGARGCITRDGSNMYQVSVAWQGSAATVAPSAGVTCGQGLYGTNDAMRRAVSITVQL